MFVSDCPVLTIPWKWLNVQESLSTGGLHFTIGVAWGSREGWSQGAKKTDAESPESVSLRNRMVMLRNSSFRAWYWVLLQKGSLGFPGGSVVKNLPAKQETQVQSLGQEDPLEVEMATHSSILA